MAKKTVPSRFPSAIAVTGLFGTIPRTTSVSDGGACDSASPATNSTPRPGWMTFATARPITPATVVVTAYSATVAPPIRPSRAGESCRIPVNRVKTMIGTTSMLSSRRNRSPSGWTTVIRSPKTIPAADPITNAIAIR
jgi:hypothetical protein